MKLILVIILLAGCSNYQALLEKVPYAEFERFQYNRVTGLSSAKIECEGAKLDADEGITIDRVYINESFPGFTISAELVGYRRDFKEGVQPEKMVDALR